MSTKVLHILNHSLPRTDGYAIRSANIVRFQRESGLEPVVLTSPAHLEGSSDLDMIEGVRYYRTRRASRCSLPFVGQYDAIRRMAGRIDEVVQAEGSDVLHAHSPCLWGAAAGKAARRRGLPFVYEIRGFWEDAAVDQGKCSSRSLRYRLSRWLETRVARQASVVTTIAENLRTELIQRGIDSNNVIIVPNGVDAERFTPREPDHQLESALSLNGQPCIGYLGTLYPWEGVDDLVRAVPLILSRVPNVRVLIVGGGLEETRVRSLIAELDLRDRVTFVGNVPHEEVLRYYSLMDVLVYPRKSTRNTELVTPLKPLEAMAMQKAVLGSDVGGIRELLVPETGILFRSGDPADLAEKCISLLNDPEQRRALGENARRHVTAARNWRALAKAYRQVYSQAVEACVPAGNTST